MQKAKKSNMGFTYIILGFFFLLNPNVNVLDVLPDLIGYSLMLFGIYRISDISEGMSTAFTDIRRLIYISAARIVIMLILPGMEDKGYSLVFTFIFAFAETGLLLHMFSNFFGGLDNLAMRNNIGENNPISGKCSEIRTLSVIFVIVKAFFNVLPECVYLSTSDYSGIITQIGTFDIANYSTLLMISNIAAVGIFGIIWYIVTTQFLLGIKRDNIFISAISDRYNSEIATNTVHLSERIFKTALIFLGIGFCLSFDIYLDGINYIPNFIAAIIIAAGFIILGKRMTECRKLLIITSVYGVISTVLWSLSYVLGHSFYSYNVFRNFGTYYMFIGTIILAVLSCAAFIILIFSASKQLNCIIDNHAGVPEDDRFVKMINQRKKIMSELHRRITMFKIFGTIFAVSGAINTACIYTFREYWMINILFGIIFVFITSSLFMELHSQITAHYEML